MNKKRYMTLTVKKEDLDLFKKISDFLQIKRTALFHKVVVALLKKIEKRSKK